MFKLVIQDDEGKTTVVPLIRDEITIGRKEGNTIRLTERNVSRRHARIVRNNGEVQIEDLGSYNGIRVNNARIAERVSLRISDQVQIGDYKLYLKAEGVEQVDDARTMPIERVDTATATDVIPAVQPTATQPMPAAVAAAAGTPAPVLVGNPNRTMVAIADTDPAGRPVATAATVAALSAPVGYGKLVVLSSNFAGKEFELSRPQMIIGRTDENDLCINHRSISRNHAKLVREPETGRYTISDLQSSNGVRVNGQDYGKVELRRGDVIDLGHVRLRFVEPGEDFVFTRDAVITDVPETGKKGMMIAVVLGAVVLLAVIIFFATRKSSTDGGKGSNGMATIDAGPTTVAVKGSNDVGSDGSDDVGSDGSGTQPTLTIDAGEPSGSGSQMITPPPTGATAELENRCAEAATQRKWTNLQDCANQLKPLSAARAKMWDDKAASEVKAESNLAKVKSAVADENIVEANRAANTIPKTSVYWADAQKEYGGLERKMGADARKTAQKYASDKKCKELDVFIKQQPQPLQRDLRTIQCTDSGSATVPPPPKNDCSQEKLDEYDKKGKDAFGASQDGVAQANFDKFLACKNDQNTLVMATISACRMGNQPKAKALYNRISTEAKKNQAEGRCLSFKVSVR